MSNDWPTTQHPLKKNVARLLALKDEYGSRALLEAIRRALAHRAYGADYIENILYQEMTPTRVHPPVRLDNREALNRIRLQEPSLADYDAFVVQRRNHHDVSSTKSRKSSPNCSSKP